MDKKHFVEAAKVLKTLPKRNFKQSYEFIMNFRGLDLKKPEHQVELWVKLPFDKGKKTKIAALVGPELAEQAKANCDFVVLHDNFAQYAGKKKEIKKLASQYDYFIAQANIMPDVAKTFGRYFGPRGKMPNPKAGCVVPPNANLKTLTEALKKTVKVSAKLQPSIKVRKHASNIQQRTAQATTRSIQHQINATKIINEPTSQNHRQRNRSTKS
jgi:large subunit ribosomal protein L1